MIILVPGITGNLGQFVGKAVLSAGHQLRGLGRTAPGDLPTDLTDNFESYIQFRGYDDIPALDAACQGIDAIICCYAPQPALALTGQLLLLEAASRAGIKRFHAASWNLDWTDFALGQLETYDAYISFYHHARLTSSIKPLYTFTGVLAMTFFAVPKAGALEDANAFWVRDHGADRTINVIGTGEEMFDWVTEADAAAFSVALVTSERAEAGGCFHFCSRKISLREVREAYLGVHPQASVGWNQVPLPVEQLAAMADAQRKAAIDSGALRERYRDFIGLVYLDHMLRGIGALDRSDAGLFPQVKTTGLEEYIRNSGVP